MSLWRSADCILELKSAFPRWTERQSFHRTRLDVYFSSSSFEIRYFNKCPNLNSSMFIEWRWKYSMLRNKAFIKLLLVARWEDVWISHPGLSTQLLAGNVGRVWRLLWRLDYSKITQKANLNLNMFKFKLFGDFFSLPSPSCPPYGDKINVDYHLAQRLREITSVLIKGRYSFRLFFTLFLLLKIKYDQHNLAFFFDKTEWQLSSTK